jgi:hypothetical protein
MGYCTELRSFGYGSTVCFLMEGLGRMEYCMSGVGTWNMAQRNVSQLGVARIESID